MLPQFVVMTGKRQPKLDRLNRHDRTAAHPKPATNPNAATPALPTTTRAPAVIAVNPSAWCTEEIMTQYFALLRSPTVLPTGRILLLLDSFSAHQTDAVRRLATTLDITLMLIPPHCTSVVQPLDVRLFARFKQRLFAWYKRHPWIEAPIPITHPQISAKQRKAAVAQVIEWVCDSFTANEVCSAWIASGLSAALETDASLRAPLHAVISTDNSLRFSTESIEPADRPQLPSNLPIATVTELAPPPSARERAHAASAERYRRLLSERSSDSKRTQTTSSFEAGNRSYFAGLIHTPHASVSRCSF